MILKQPNDNAAGRVSELSETYETKISKGELLVLAKTLNRLQEEMKWMVDFVKAKAKEMDLKI